MRSLAIRFFPAPKPCSWSDSLGNVVSRRDFLPFGEELYADGTHRTTVGKYSQTGKDGVRQRFTGYQKDVTDPRAPLANNRNNTQAKPGDQPPNPAIWTTRERDPRKGVVSDPDKKIVYRNRRRPNEEEE